MVQVITQNTHMQAITEIQENTHQAKNRSKHDANDLRILNEMLYILISIQVQQSVRPDELSELAELANSIAFEDKDGHCVRNKYGSINRSKNCEPRENGVLFMQMAWMRHIDTEKIT